MKFVLLAAVAALVAGSVGARAAGLLDIPLKDIHGKDTSLKAWKGKVLLIVNVASECGYTPQYAGLEALYQKHKDAGLVVLGFPCNQFGGQEPGGEAEILKFCTGNYHVTFPMFSKVEVNGPGAHPLFAALTGKDSPAPGPVAWNFGKFLIGRDGKIVKRFDSGDEPESPEVVSAIAAALKTK
ncbi:MAG: glutathione peroxidase [Verrucomicrobia bacterium]|nr:glutathione peroxidase [Verrucomicrobiota bacterium]